jgi:hypothetical protein
MSALTLAGLFLGIQAQVAFKNKNWKAFTLTILLALSLLLGIYTDWKPLL